MSRVPVEALDVVILGDGRVRYHARFAEPVFERVLPESEDSCCICASQPEQKTQEELAGRSQSRPHNSQNFGSTVVTGIPSAVWIVLMVVVLALAMVIIADQCGAIAQSLEKQ